MKVTVIGCYGGFPTANEATSGYLFQSGDFSLLVDCGSAVLSKLFGYVPAEKLDAVVLSHYHHDHIADIGRCNLPSKSVRFSAKESIRFRFTDMMLI